MSLRTHVLAAAIAAASWSIVPAAFAQEQPEDPATEPSQDWSEPTEQAAPAQEPAEPSTGSTAAVPIDDEKIEQFADAYVAVQTIQQKAAADLQTATDAGQADKVKAKAENDMIAAVERTGLKIDEFNQIVETMASDVNVRTRIAEKVQQRTGGT